ncbi:MAG: hypothetical protein IJ640_06675 [Prevotella sp.]|nr:hypothetical protein [Prevotella sp.]
MENFLPRSKAKPIEQLPTGEWVVRYAIRPTGGRTASGEEIVTFGMSQYAMKPTLEQIRRSINRYAKAFIDDDEILSLTANPDYSVYMVTDCLTP